MADSLMQYVSKHVGEETDRPEGDAICASPGVKANFLLVDSLHSRDKVAQRDQACGERRLPRYSTAGYPTAGHNYFCVYPYSTTSTPFESTVAGMSFRTLGQDLLYGFRLLLKSPAFVAGRRIPKRYTCDGQNREPPLVVLNEGASEIPLVFVHGDVRGGGWYCRRLAERLVDRPIIVLPTFRPGKHVPATV